MDKSKNSTSTNDDLAGDLLQIIVDSKVQAKKNVPAGLHTIRGKAEFMKQYDDVLMMKLVSYITRRDHRVFDHAFKLGKERGTKS